MQEVLRKAGPWAAEMAAENATEIDEREYQRIVRLAARIAGVEEAQDIAQKAFLIARTGLPVGEARKKLTEVTDALVTSRPRVLQRRSAR